MITRIQEIHRLQYGPAADLTVYFSPGRVNLIGEHIDYNGGYVFPAALSIGNFGAFSPRADRCVRLYSENFPGAGVVTLDLDRLDYRKADSWANYAKGVIRELQARRPFSHGFDAVVWGDLPQASGLSSSASIELLFATYLNDAFALGLSRPNLAVLCKKVENEYIGVNCGIMDQFVIANGKKDHALLLDCATLAFSAVPLDLKDHDIVIVNSKVKRGLVDSKYNERRAECDAALAILAKSVPVRALCELDKPTFVSAAAGLPDVLFRRAKHAVFENARTIGAAEQLNQGDLAAFGAAMNASHDSLRDDYEVSIPELDRLVELALEHGAIGARMTGAGFGGCTVNLVPKALVPAFSVGVAEGYYRSFGLLAEVYVAAPSDGTRKVA